MLNILLNLLKRFLSTRVCTDDIGCSYFIYYLKEYSPIACMQFHWNIWDKKCLIESLVDLLYTMSASVGNIYD